jgi:Trk-type K+ transport system membrane component
VSVCSLSYQERSLTKDSDIEEIPVGTRIAAAFVQSAAVRAAGFAIVPLASLAPAVKVLYVVMMVSPSSIGVRLGVCES